MPAHADVVYTVYAGKGKPIIALPSVAGKANQSKIVPTIQEVSVYAFICVDVFAGWGCGNHTCARALRGD